MRKLWVCVCLLGMCASARANDTAVRGVGGAIQPMAQHQSVRMASEKVDVELTERDAHVRCEFVFTNTGKATVVKMGFPEEASGDVRPIKKSAYRVFRSWVDGRPITVTFIPSKQEQSDREEYVAWHVKEVPFAEGQTRTIVDEYQSALGGVSDGSSFFAYILKTGKNWKGRIGEATISVDVAAIPKHFEIKPQPAGYVRCGTRLIWILRNFEPDHDVYIELQPRMPILNGQKISPFDAQPFSFPEGVVMLRASALEKRKLARITWDQQNRVCRIIYQDQTLELRLNTKKALLNGWQEVELARSPVVERGYFVVPIASVVQALGGTARSDPKTGQLYLRLPAERPDALSSSINDWPPSESLVASPKTPWVGADWIWHDANPATSVSNHYFDVPQSNGSKRRIWFGIRTAVMR